MDQGRGEGSEQGCRKMLLAVISSVQRQVLSMGFMLVKRQTTPPNLGTSTVSSNSDLELGKLGLRHLFHLLLPAPIAAKAGNYIAGNYIVPSMVKGQRLEFHSKLKAFMTVSKWRKWQIGTVRQSSWNVAENLSSRTMRHVLTFD